MKPHIGITSQIIHKVKWYKHVRDTGFETIEINRQDSKLHFNLYFLEKVKRYLSGCNLSIHSGTSGVFQPLEPFTEANLAILRAEINVCRLLGATELVFHLNDGILSKENKERLKQVFDYAKIHNIQMLYESNHALVANYAYDFLESFPKIGYVLDLGHLNNGYGTGKLGCEIDEFLVNVRKRVIYIHASNNSGTRDEHLGLDQGTLDWRKTLDLLDFSKIRKVIIEVRSLDMVENTRKALAEYLVKRLNSA